MTNDVLLDRSDGVAHLTLNRPDSGNAIDVPLAKSLLKAVTEVEDDPTVRCVVLGANGRMFCAGGDVRALHAAGSALPDLLREIISHLHPAIARLAGMPKPVITAIQGPAAGAGIALAAVGDIALAAPGAHFTMAYSRIGLTPDGGATWLLPRLVGFRRAQELALTNRRLSAAEAAELGLITRTVAEGALASEVDAQAQSLSAAATGAIGQTKRLLMAGTGARFEDHLDAERDRIAEQGGTAEARVGLSAFASRSEPDFRGSVL